MIGTIYLIHFSTPLHHARHYLGWTTDLPLRLAAHSSGNGSRIMAAVSNAGIEWNVTRTWPNADRNMERHIKNTHHISRFCPICQQESKIATL